MIIIKCSPTNKLYLEAIYIDKSYYAKYPRNYYIIYRYTLLGIRSNKH